MDELHKIWKTTRLLGMTMPLAPVPLLVGLVYMLHTGLEPQQMAAAMPVALTVVALAEIGMVFVIRRVLMGGVALTGPEEFAVSRAEPVPREEALAALAAAAMRYYRGTTVGMAIGFSIAIYGFVLGLLSATLMIMVPFVLVAVVVMAAQFPRWSALLSLVPPGVVVTVRQERIDP